MRRNEIFLSTAILSFYIVQLNSIIRETMEECRSFVKHCQHLDRPVSFRSSVLKHSYDMGVPQVATIVKSHSLPSSANPCILACAIIYIPSKQKQLLMSGYFKAAEGIVSAGRELKQTRFFPRLPAELWD